MSGNRVMKVEGGAFSFLVADDVRVQAGGWSKTGICIGRSVVDKEHFEVFIILSRQAAYALIKKSPRVMEGRNYNDVVLLFIRSIAVAPKQFVRELSCLHRGQINSLGQFFLAQQHVRCFD